MLLQSVVSQHVTREQYKYVPDLGTYDEEWTDEKLRERWGITAAEW